MKNSTKPRSLRAIAIGSTISAPILFAVVFLILFFSSLSRALNHAEAEHISELNGIIQASLQSNLEELRDTARSLSDLQMYIEAKNSGRLFENGTMLSIHHVDYVVIKDADGNDLYTGTRAADENGVRPEIPAGLSAHIDPIAEDVVKAASGAYDNPYCDAGFIALDGQSYIISVVPVMFVVKNGDVTGTLSLISKYGDAEFKLLTRMTGATFTVREQDPANPVTESIIDTVNDRCVTMSTVIENVGGSDRSAVLYLEAPRHLYNSGFTMAVPTAAATLLALAFSFFILYIAISRSVIRPIRRIINDISAISEQDLIDTEAYKGVNELHTLMSTINGMRMRLHSSHAAVTSSQVSLTVLTNILNGLDAYLYVSDPESDEILFINDKMRMHFGLSGDGVGETCWKVLQSNFTERCEFCPCRKLEKNPDEIVEWEEENTVTGRYYRNTDAMIEWIGGRKVHLQHSVDITDIKNAERTLQRRYEQQRIMTSISQTFLPNEDVDTQINLALKMTGEFLSAQRVLAVQYDGDAQKLTYANEWRSADCDVPDSNYIDLIGRLSHDSAPYIIFSDNSSQGAEMAAHLTIPISIGAELWGVLDISGRDSGRTWSESDISLARLVSNTLSGVIGRRRIETQIRMLGSIVESSPQLIIYLSPDGNISYANPVVSDVTGFTEQELLQGGLELIYGEDTARTIKTKYLPETLAKGQVNREDPMITKSGETKILAVTSFAMGTDGSIGAILKDVTDMRALEAELIAAKELAEQGSRTKSAFLSRMSHEMRTPMNAIIGMTNIAVDTDDPVKKEDCLEKIGNASRSLLALINDILDMSKIEADKFELNSDGFVFRDMIGNVVNFISFKAEEKKQDLKIAIDPNIPSRLIGDEQRLGQVITNLLANAVKFTPDNGNIELSAHLEQEAGNLLTLEIAVSDNGIGISKEQQKKLFQSFEQADGGIARKFGGTGLGLAISKRIIQMMGGDIQIESEAGEGASFIFTVKLERDNADKAGTQPESSGEIDVDDGDYNFTGKRALLAEDVEINCEIVIAAVDGTGLEIDVASDGREAVSKFSQDPQKYDIILMDMHMPEVDGLEATRRIRALETERAKTIPIVAMTANVFKEDVEACLKSGMNDHIGKPVDFEQLLATIHKYTKG